MDPEKNNDIKTAYAEIPQNLKEMTPTQFYIFVENIIKVLKTV